jgi:hypothetical protein
MIVKIGRGGKSFKGLSEYLTHDPETRTDERVAWTHTHNLASDHVPSAVDEMYWTAQNAELLKQEAGVRAGGRATESPVKHISLNWSPDDNPTREHMIETTEGFLRHMNWHEHQAVLVAHNDKAYRHVHVMLNVVHPETGMRVHDDFEYRRAQAWALEYERQQGHIHCEQRLNNVKGREKSMPRNIWMTFQQNEKEFQRIEQNYNENSEIRFKEPENARDVEWKILKEIQRVERQEFFAQGKVEFSELRRTIYREVREEFKPRWADYYKVEKNGAPEDRDILAGVKGELVAEQKAVLEPRRDAACKELRESRDLRYREMLDNQKEARADLRWHQEAGLDTPPFFSDLTATADARRELEASFGSVAHEVTAPQPGLEAANVRDSALNDDDEVGPSEAPGAPGKFSRSLGHTAVAFLDSLFTDLTNLGGGSTDPRPRSAEEVFQAAADETERRQQLELENFDIEWRERQKDRE